MKKVVIVSPFYNGLYKYTRPLYEELRKKYKDYEFVHIGNPKMTFEISEIEKIVDDLSDRIIEEKPDIIHYNYGTYDVEQLLPYMLDQKGFRCIQLLTYHSLQLDLFKKINCPEYDIETNKYMGLMDGYIFFTEYAKKIFYDKYKDSCKINKIAYHPATHLDQHVSLDVMNKLDKEFGIDRTKKIATLLGYPSHWKDTVPVIKLVNKYPEITFVVAGPWWEEKIIKENPKIILEELNNLIIINKELNTDEFNYAMDLGVGLFPYKYFKSFQGSGLLPNYLYRGLNVLVSNIDPLKEYTNNVIDIYNDKMLTKRFEEIINNKNIEKDNNFSYEKHAEIIENLYREIKL